MSHVLVVRTLRAILTLSLFGVATPTIAGAQCGRHQLLVNGRTICAGTDDIVALLRQFAGSNRLALSSTEADEQPIVLVDGVQLHGGITRLGDISLAHIESVTVLRPLDAVARYGTKAGRGAILVTTVSGRKRLDGRGR